MGSKNTLIPEMDICLGEMLSDKEADDLRPTIPLNPLATPELISSLKGSDPMDCVFRVYYRENNRGWIYDDSAYDDIAETILTSPVFVPSCYGHQAQDAVAYEGRPLMGTVIGVLLDKANGFVYYRIIPDAGEGAKDIRRWLKNKQINAVSIWGFPFVMNVGGKTHVTGYRLRSVDFVPPLTEGQKNDGVSIGEMDVSFEEKRRLIQAALHDKYPDDNTWSWVEETYLDYIIANHGDEFYKIPYSELDGKIILGDAVKVRLVKTYEPIQEDVMELKDVSNDALLAEIKTRASEGRFVAPEKAAGEMGLVLENAEEKKRLQADAAKLAELKTAAGEMGVERAIEIAKTSVAAESAAKEEKAFGEMVSALKLEKGLVDKEGKATGEMANLVQKFAKVEKGMTREQVSGEMDRIINDEAMKKIVSTAQKPIGEMHAASGSAESFEM